MEIGEEEQRQRQRPEQERRHDAADAPAVEGPHPLAYGQQQHAGHHHEERHAAPDQTAGESAGQKRAAIGVELPHEGVAAVGENDQKTGQHTQQVYPADVLSARKRIFHLFEV